MSSQFVEKQAKAILSQLQKTPEEKLIDDTIHRILPTWLHNHADEIATILTDGADRRLLENLLFEETRIYVPSLVKKQYKRKNYPKPWKDHKFIRDDNGDINYEITWRGSATNFLNKTYKHAFGEKGSFREFMFEHIDFEPFQLKHIASKLMAFDPLDYTEEKLGELIGTSEENYKNLRPAYTAACLMLIKSENTKMLEHAINSFEEYRKYMNIAQTNRAKKNIQPEFHESMPDACAEHLWEHLVRVASFSKPELLKIIANLENNEQEYDAYNLLSDIYHAAFLPRPESRHEAKERMKAVYNDIHERIMTQWNVNDYSEDDNDEVW